MPFKVTPSEQVVIDDSDVGDDDLLMVELADGTLLFVERYTSGHGFVYFRLALGLEPKRLRKLQRVHARTKLRKAWQEGERGKSNFHFARIQEWFDNQPEDDLFEAVFTRVVEAGFSLQDEMVQIGRTLQGRLTAPDTVNVFPRVETEWSFDSPITQITPIDRWKARVYMAGQ